MNSIPYDPKTDDLELLLIAIQRYQAVTTVEEFNQCRLFVTGVNLRLLRLRPDLDRELTIAYRDARARLWGGGGEGVNWIEQTKSRFPNLFDPAANRDFSCGDGWREIVEALCENLDRLDLVNLRVVQIKQRMGGLRVYLNGGSADTGALIAEAQHEAERTCEQCEADLLGPPIGGPRFWRKIAIVDPDLDRAVAFRCPDCGHTWPREFNSSPEAG